MYFRLNLLLQMIGGALIFCIATSAVMGVDRLPPPAWEKHWVVAGDVVNIEYRTRDENRKAWFRFKTHYMNFWEANIPERYIRVTDTLETRFLENLFTGDVSQREDDMAPIQTQYYRDGNYVQFIEFRFRRNRQGSVVFDAGFYILPRLIGGRPYFNVEKMTEAEHFLVNRGARV